MTARAESFASLTHRRRQLALLLLIAASVRGLALIHGSAVVAPRGDEAYYLKQGWAIAQGEGYEGSFRPPFYPLVVSAVFRVFGRNLLALRLVQSAISLLAVALVYQICRDRFGARAAFWSGLACAVSPALAHFAHFLWAETLFITLFLTFFWLLGRFELYGRPAALGGAGLALALAALTKEIVIFFSLLLLPWLVWRAAPHWRTGMRHVLIFLVCFTVPLVPWVARNQALHGRFVGLSTCRWFPIAVGNLRAEDELLGTANREEFRLRWRGLTDEIERERISRRAALRSIRVQQPWWLVHKAKMTALRLFSPKSQEIRFLELGLYPRDIRPFIARSHVALSLAGHLLLLAPGLMALWLIRGDPMKSVALLMIGYSLAVHTIANSTPRFLLPLLPLFYLYLGPWLAGGQRGAARWRWIGAAITAAVFLVVVLVQVPHQLGPVWNAFGQR